MTEFSYLPNIEESEIKNALEGKQILIVGGTRGIGYETARASAKRGASVAIVGSNAENGAKVLEELKKLNPNGTHEFYKANLSLVEQAKRFADDYISKHREMPLLLFCNGILAAQKRTETSEGLEEEMTINYLSRFVILFKLIPLLQNTKGRPRVINLASSGIHNGSFDVEDLMALNRSYSASTQHFQTVVANDAMVKEFTKRFGEKIDFFGMGPGFLPTEMRARAGLWTFIDTLFGWSMGTTEAYSETYVLNVLSNPKLTNKSGMLFGISFPRFGRGWVHTNPCKEADTARLWEVSKQFAKLT